MSTRIKIEEEITLGRLLRTLLEKRTGEIRLQTTDYYDRPTTAGITDATYEQVAEEFAATLRAHDRREGNKPPHQGG